MTQTETICQYMKQHGRITQQDAIRFGCFRLAARIHDLKQGGLRIETEMIKEGKKQWASYSLVKKFSECLF